jgi:hypothetical protein
MSGRQASRRTREPRKYLVTIAGRTPAKGYDERRVRSLKTNPRVLLYIDDTGEKAKTATVLRRLRRKLQFRGLLRGQSLRALEALFVEPEQRLEALFPWGGVEARRRALRRLRELVDTPAENGGWELINLRRQGGVDIVSFGPGGGLCIMVRLAPGDGRTEEAARGDRPRLEARSGIHCHPAGLVLAELRVLNPTEALVTSLDPVVHVDGQEFESCDPAFARELYPDFQFGEAPVRVDPRSASPWRWFAFSADHLATAKPVPPEGDSRPRLRAALADPLTTDEARGNVRAELERLGPSWRTTYPPAEVRMRTLDGVTLKPALLELSAEPN